MSKRTTGKVAFLTTSERNQLAVDGSEGSDGMRIFNTSTKTLDININGVWKSLKTKTIGDNTNIHERNYAAFKTPAGFIAQSGLTSISNFEHISSSSNSLVTLAGDSTTFSVSSTGKYLITGQFSFSSPSHEAYVELGLYEDDVLVTTHARHGLIDLEFNAYTCVAFKDVLTLNSGSDYVWKFSSGLGGNVSLYAQHTAVIYELVV